MSKTVIDCLFTVKANEALCYLLGVGWTKNTTDDEVGKGHRQYSH